tara:strand:- start:3324 stop:4769 length:1446 start_codon:yes stop_codon:yes gene_type:complete
MNRKLINLEINEISPKLLIDYIFIKRNKNKILSKLFFRNKLKIYTTKALDIDKEKLYPSQTWASFLTGKPFSEHKCYWYSDYLNKDDILWNKLALNNKSVGIINSVHSSKIPNDLLTNNFYKFYLPDCFGDKKIAKPEKFKNFQAFNNALVGESSRVTGLKSLLKIIYKNIIFILKSPSSYGISIFSIKLVLIILFSSIKYKNKELIRMAQFPLLASIFIDLLKQYKPDYSALFSNHVAGNMHRYWYAHDTSSFLKKNKYPKEWILKNKNVINISMDLLDYFLNLIYCNKLFSDYTICITSSMGQEPNPNFDEKFLSNFDGKIDNINLFIEHLSNYQSRYLNKKVKYNVERNMAPQYGFNFEDQRNLNLYEISQSIGNFISEIGLKFNIDINGFSIVITIDPSKDENLQKNFNLKKANDLYSKYGFKFFPVEDHHSGSHSREGILAVINPSKSFQEKIDQSLDENGEINYLSFHDIVLSSI